MERKLTKLEETEEILKKGLDLNQYSLIEIIAKGENIKKLLTYQRINGVVNLLVKKGYLKRFYENITITEEGKKLLISPIIPEVKNEEHNYELLKEKLANKLLELTGRKQYFINVKGTEYPYLPSIADLKNKIEKFKSFYKMTDMDKIEKCLLKHCEKRNQKMIYYIMKERGDSKSDLAADYENFSEEEHEEHEGLKIDIA